MILMMKESLHGWCRSLHGNVEVFLISNNILMILMMKESLHGWNYCLNYLISEYKIDTIVKYSVNITILIYLILYCI